jgi:GNAT superfamily N-acetyltransferase
MSKVAETRGGTNADFDFAWKLYAESVRPLIEPHILRERNEHWVDKEEKARFSYIWDPAKVLIITCDSMPIGWLAIADSEDAIRIENFYIEKKYRNKGLGTAVLVWLVHHYQKRPVTASVITSCPSRSLYERVGFVVTEQIGFETRMQLS